MIQLDVEEAIRAKEEGIQRALDPRTAYREQVWNAILSLADSKVEFSGDEVRLLCGEPPRGVSGNVIGALFHQAAKGGVIRRIGYRISAQKQGHGNLVRTWIGA
jgi:hypothetical protein